MLTCKDVAEAIGRDEWRAAVATPRATTSSADVPALPPLRRPDPGHRHRGPQPDPGAR